MSAKPQIIKCTAREILDSRGNPTVEATVVLSDGSIGVASVPSGASTGIYEAVEKRDNDMERYHGKGVLTAVNNVCRIISPSLVGVYVTEQSEIDKILCALDGSDNKENIGANAILAVSIAAARAGANSYKIPLYRYIGGVSATRLPIPMMNIMNGGAHASNNLEIQEFMIVPIGAPTFSDALRMGSEIYHTLGKILKSEGKSVGVGDEGGYAPDLESDRMAIEYIIKAINDSGYSTENIKIALDVAASEWYNATDGMYHHTKRGQILSREDVIKYICSLCEDYPIMSVEDPLDQRDFEGWRHITDKLGRKVMLVGDDLFVTSTRRVTQGIEEGMANSVLIKPNQIGTLSEVANVIEIANGADYKCIMSHRSGETEDTTIADLAVGYGTPFIKAGAPARSDRVAKYNRLLRIEASIGGAAIYGLNSTSQKPKYVTYCDC